MFGWFEWTLALRFLRPKRTYVSIITMLSLVGVLLGVMVLILVLSVMEGFQRELRDKIIGFNAHLTVSNFAIVEDPESLAETIRADPSVVAITPFVLGPVLLEVYGRISTPYIKGIEPATAEQVVPLRDSLVAGEWLLGPDTILVGHEWATRNGVWLGDKVLVFSPRNIRHLRPDAEAETEAVMLPAEYYIAGVFSTGFYDYDSNFVLLEISEAQRLYSIDGVHGLAVRLRDAFDAVPAQLRLNERLEPPMRALTWIDQNSRLVSAVAVERRVMTFLLFFIMLVAAFGLSSTLITVTVQKTGEIGLLKALGAHDSQIVTIFTLYGLIVGVIGASLGTSAGLLLLAFRNEFSAWLEATFRVEIFPAEIYNFLEIPAVIDPWTVAGIALSGVLVSTGAALLPAIAAARIDPARALHHA